MYPWEVIDLFKGPHTQESTKWISRNSGKSIIFYRSVIDPRTGNTSCFLGSGKRFDSFLSLSCCCRFHSKITAWYFVKVNFWGPHMAYGIAWEDDFPFQVVELFWIHSCCILWTCRILQDDMPTLIRNTMVWLSPESFSMILVTLIWLKKHTLEPAPFTEVIREQKQLIICLILQVNLGSIFLKHFHWCESTSIIFNYINYILELQSHPLDYIQCGTAMTQKLMLRLPPGPKSGNPNFLIPNSNVWVNINQLFHVKHKTNT